MAKVIAANDPRSQRLRIRRLIEAIRDRPRFMNKKLNRMKKSGPKLACESDFVWKAILRSFSTWGGINGKEDFEDDFQKVQYRKLKNLSDEERKSQLKDVFWTKWGRYQKLKLAHACANLVKIDGLGGSASASRKARLLKGKTAKLTFMRRFGGVGAKYANNIWMDAYDVDFRDSIAVDARIINILKALGRDSDVRGYKTREEFFNGIAAQAGIEGWYLDRLLFNFMPYFIWAIEADD